MNESFKEEQTGVIVEDGEEEIKAFAQVFNLPPGEVKEALLLYSSFTSQGNLEKVARLKF